MFENPYNSQQETKICPICSRPFTAHPSKRYCSRRCKNKAKTVRTKITELAPHSVSTFHQIELLAPTIEDLDLLCKQLLFRDDDTICKVKILPQGWQCPPNIMCRHIIHNSNKAKNIYEIYAAATGGFVELNVEVTPEQLEAFKKLEDAAAHKRFKEKMAAITASVATKTQTKEELATIELFDGTRVENLTLQELDKFCMEHFYNKHDTTLTNELNEEIGKIIYS